MAISPVAPTIDENGISAPSLVAILEYLQSQYKQIFGADVYLGADSQDGEFLGILAAAINDSNAAAVAIYNSFSPATAKGTGLSNVVKINGLSRKAASASTVDLTCTGVAGTLIRSGVVADEDGYKWDLPASVTIGPSGSVVATATCETQGSIAAAPNAVTEILTPTRGWQAVTNDSAATPGSDVELDGALRQRQSISTGLPSLSIMQGIVGAVANIRGVSRYKGYENDSDATDANGLPAHSIALVVDGGDADVIAQTIFTKKSPGTATHGSTNVTVTDAVGIPNVIDFYRPTVVAVQVSITIKALTGYLSTIGEDIQQAVADYINALDIGEDVYLTRLYTPANLSGAADAQTYDITALAIGKNGGAQSASNVTIAFDEAAGCVVTDVSIAVQ